MRREVILPTEQPNYAAMGRSTAPWYTRWILWLAAVDRGEVEP